MNTAPAQAPAQVGQPHPVGAPQQPVGAQQQQPLVAPPQQQPLGAPQQQPLGAQQGPVMAPLLPVVAPPPQPARPRKTMLHTSASNEISCCWVVKNFTTMAHLMLYWVRTLDSTLQQPSSRDFVESLLWLCSDCFLDLYDRVGRRMDDADRSDFYFRICSLGFTVNAVCDNAGYVPPVMFRSDMRYNQPGNTAPAQGPFELCVETIMPHMQYSFSTVDNAATALRSLFRGNLDGFSANQWKCGLPQVIFICQGPPPAPPGGPNPRLLISCNKAPWGQYDDVSDWFQDARQIGLSAAYCTNLRRLTNIAYTNRVDLQHAFYNGPAAGADVRLAARWTALTQNNATVNPKVYARAGHIAKAFEFPEMAHTSRCGRCRAVFQYAVPAGEPFVFGAVYRKWHTCAEVLAWRRCEGGH